MVEINVLILSAGRRVELVKLFQRAAKKLNIKSKVIAGDCSDLAPALYVADKSYKLPRIHHPDYIKKIIEICTEENISLVVPTIDTDLILLAENRDVIEQNTNAKVLVSSLDVVKICRDKNKTHKFLQEHNFGVPKMFTMVELLKDKNNIKFPLFIKPKSGSSSINTFKVNDLNELMFFYNYIEEPIIQEYIEGDEYTVDVFLDFNSKVITVVPRLRLAVRSGEISKGKIIKDKEIINDVISLMENLKPIGHITVQLMKTKQGIKYIEINPRFGGGAPMSIESGADSCENLFRLLMGETLEYNEEYKDNITFLRFDCSICLNENMELVQ